MPGLRVRVKESGVSALPARSPQVSPSNLTPLPKSTQHAMSEEGNPACLTCFSCFVVSTSTLTPTGVRHLQRGGQISDVVDEDVRSV